VIEGRILGAGKPSSKIDILGRHFDTPIMTGALCFLKDGMIGFAEGAKKSGALCSVGMGSNEELKELLSTGADLIKIIKPYADPKEILSHHNSIMPWAIPPYALRKDIRASVGKDFILIADGGIEDGFDAFKVLAMGADLVCIGRPLMSAYNEHGADGVAEVIYTLSSQLRSMMWRTGAADLSSIDPEVLHYAPWLQQ